MNTIMVIGPTGFIGSNLILHLRKKHKVIAMFRRNMIRFDGVSSFFYSFEDRDYIKRLMVMLKPNFIIYLAGMTDILECHQKPNVADAVHSLGPVFFSDAAQSVPHRFIYISTAYVFDGKKGSYHEGDLPMAETTLGKSKLAGENYVRSKSQLFTLFRLSPVFGVGSILHFSFLDKMRIALAQGQRHELPGNEHHSFLYLDTFIDAIDWVIQNESKNETYHLGGLTKLSTYEFGVECAKILGLDETLLSPNRGIFTEHANLDFSLNGTKFVKASQINPLVLEESLDLFKKLLIR